jgi:hypothetical protein
MATRKQTTALVNWDEELAKQAAIDAGMEDSTATGQFFSTKGGILCFNDAPLPNNQMAVVVLDAILENVFYEGKYDPENPTGPVCFAFGRDEKTLTPHQIVVEAGNAQHEMCAGCELNEWGSADVGRGKACRNTRRLVMIAAGSFNAAGKFELIEEPEHYETAAIAFLKLPVTSVKGYAATVKQVTGALKRAMWSMVMKVKVVPDPKSQFKVVFEPVMNLPDELLGTVKKRHDEAMAVIDFPYQPNEEEEPKPAPKSRAAQRPAVKKAGRKY